MPVVDRSLLAIGQSVLIVQKHHQSTGQLTQGTVAALLTGSAVHPRGIKVRTTNGLVGRVERIVSNSSGSTTTTTKGGGGNGNSNSNANNTSGGGGIGNNMVRTDACTVGGRRGGGIPSSSSTTDGIRIVAANRGVAYAEDGEDDEGEDEDADDHQHRGGFSRFAVSRSSDYVREHGRQRAAAQRRRSDDDHHVLGGCGDGSVDWNRRPTAGGPSTSNSCAGFPHHRRHADHDQGRGDYYSDGDGEDVVDSSHPFGSEFTAPLPLPPPCVRGRVSDDWPTLSLGGSNAVSSTMKTLAGSGGGSGPMRGRSDGGGNTISSLFPSSTCPQKQPKKRQKKGSALVSSRDASAAEAVPLSSPVSSSPLPPSHPSVSSGGGDGGDTLWSCWQCTFINKSCALLEGNDTCEMCDAARQQQPQ